MHNYTFLALGDSYTIGESVQLTQSFSYQAVQLLRSKGHNFHAPEIVAKTGWTTAELERAIKDYKFLPKYDFVSLLIGVNNQYRGEGVVMYKEQFEELLKKAIRLADDKKDQVIVVSIPDYSITPFAASLEKAKIKKEIDVFNSVNMALSIQYKVRYLDISTEPGEAGNELGLTAEDGLHPSASEYARWAEKLAELISSQLK